VGWKNDKTRKAFDNSVTKPDGVTIYGVKNAVHEWQAGNTEFTRHHIIPHELLISAWEYAVDQAETRTEPYPAKLALLHAFATWGHKTAADLPVSLTAVTPEPQTVLKKVAWNPFNIIIGPKGEHRVEDPESNFDAFSFSRFGPKPVSIATKMLSGSAEMKLNLALQDFNRHFGTLRRIYLLLRMMVEGQASRQHLDSLALLLKADIPSNYPNLFAMNRELTTGALLSPDLWTKFTTSNLNDAPEDRFVKPARTRPAPITPPLPGAKPKVEGLKIDNPSTSGIYAQNLLNKFAGGTPILVPWVASSWLPEVDPVMPKMAEPVLDTSDNAVWAPGEANVPYERLLMKTMLAKDLKEFEFRGALTRALNELKTLPAFTAHKQARVLIFGPADATRTTLARWTGSELKKVVRKDFELKISRTMFEHGALQLRFYDYLRSGG
jgi:hypothetical protein